MIKPLPSPHDCYWCHSSALPEVRKHSSSNTGLMILRDVIFSVDQHQVHLLECLLAIYPVLLAVAFYSLPAKTMQLTSPVDLFFLGSHIVLVVAFQENMKSPSSTMTNMSKWTSWLFPLFSMHTMNFCFIAVS